MNKKTLIAATLSALFFSSALVGIGSASADELVIAPLGVVVRDGASINVGAGNIAPVLGLQAIKKIDADTIGKNLDISLQDVGVNVAIDSEQKVDDVNVLAQNGGLVAGAQLVGPVDVKKVDGSVSITGTHVGAAVAINLTKPAVN